MLALIAAIGGSLYGVADPWDHCRQSWSRCRRRRLVLLPRHRAHRRDPERGRGAADHQRAVLPLYFLSGVFIPETEIPTASSTSPTSSRSAPSSRRSSTPGPAQRRAASTGRTSRSSRPGGSPGCCSRSASSAGRPGAERPTGDLRDRAYSLRLDVPPRPPRGLRPRAQRARSTTRCSRRSAGGAISSEDETIGWGIAKPGLLHRRPPRAASPASACSASPALGIAAVKAAWEGGVDGGRHRASVSPASAARYGSGSYSAFLKDPDGYEIEITIGTD